MLSGTTHSSESEGRARTAKGSNHLYNSHPSFNFAAGEVRYWKEGNTCVRSKLTVWVSTPSAVRRLEPRWGGRNLVLFWTDIYSRKLAISAISP
jgi:hypothetical protein